MEIFDVCYLVSVCMHLSVRKTWSLVFFQTCLIASSKSDGTCIFTCHYTPDVIFLVLYHFFTTLQWALFIHFIPVLLPLCQFSPCGSPSCPLHLDLLFSLSLTHSPVFLSALLSPSFSPSPSSHAFHASFSLTLSFPPLFLPFLLCVSCVSRTLMVTQIFWLLAVPLGWDAVSALLLEVLYILHSASYKVPALNIPLYWIDTKLWHTTSFFLQGCIKNVSNLESWLSFLLFVFRLLNKLFV